VWTFTEVVDRDNDEVYETYMNDQLVARFLESSVFRLVILMVIITNSILVGVQTDLTIATNYASTWDVIDNIFLTIFVLEIFLKWYHGFLEFWKVGWNVFDFIIVTVSVLGSGASFVSSGRVLRILRVLRAFRSLRSISALQGLQVVVQTVLVSLPDMVNVVILLGIVTFIFAVIGIQLFGGDLPRDFGDLGRAMFTLFVAVTQDGWVNIFLRCEAAGLYYPAAVYFFIFMVIGAFVFGNLISSVVVTNIQAAFYAAKQEKRARSRNLAKDKADMDAAVKPFVTPIVKPAVYQKQVPQEVPLFEHLTVAKLENYLLILSAQEENLRERQVTPRSFLPFFLSFSIIYFK
jgi:cation channel sperm-associated protein 4